MRRQRKSYGVIVSHKQIYKGKRRKERESAGARSARRRSRSIASASAHTHKKSNRVFANCGQLQPARQKILRPEKMTNDDER